MGLFGTLGNLFGKKKGKIVQEYFSPEIKQSLTDQGRRLSGQADQDYGDASRARSQWMSDMPQYNRFVDADIQRMGEYMPGGLQERRYGAGIDRYERAQMDALKNAFAGAQAQSKRQQALMGGGGMPSVFQQQSLANRLGVLGTGVAADVEGRRLGNIGRFQNTGLGLMGKRGGLLQNKTRNALQGLAISGARDKSIQGRTGGLIGQYEKGSWLRKKPDKLNWFGKTMAIGESLTGGGNSPSYGNMGSSAGGTSTPWSRMKSGWNQGGSDYQGSYPVDPFGGEGSQTAGGGGPMNFLRKGGNALAQAFLG